MKRIFLAALVSAFVLTAGYAQKIIDDPNAEKRNLSGFHGVEVSGGIDLYLSPGGESVAVSASDIKFRDRIKTEVKNGILKIWYEHDRKADIEWRNRKMKAYVSFVTLDQLGGGGGSDIIVEGVIKTNSLALQISGGSDFQGRVEANELKVDASGGSDVHISGTVARVSIEASGGSDFKGYELSSDICNLQASGGSDIYITANKELKAGASGGSDVHYKGNAVVVEINSSGSSSIKKAGR